MTSYLVEGVIEPFIPDFTHGYNQPANDNGEPIMTEKDYLHKAIQTLENAVKIHNDAHTEMVNICRAQQKCITDLQMRVASLEELLGE